MEIVTYSVTISPQYLSIQIGRHYAAGAGTDAAAEPTWRVGVKRKKIVKINHSRRVDV